MARQQKKDRYLDAMRVWFDQKAEEILSCRRVIERHRRTIVFSRKEIIHADRSIALELEQIKLAKRDVAESRKDVRNHVKRKKTAAKK